MWVSSLKLCVSMLTRLPAGNLANIEGKHWQQMPVFFPLVGYLMALFSLFLPLACWAFLTKESYQSLVPLLAVLVLTIWVWLMRGLHLDGFMDMLDGFGGGFTAERRLEIMKDSTSGSFAVAGCILLLGIKGVALAILFKQALFFQVTGCLVIGRFCMTLLSHIGRYPRNKGTAMHIVGQIPLSSVLISTVFLLPLALHPEMLVVAAIGLIVTLLLKNLSHKMIGGVTGDVLGASTEITETLSLIICCFIYLAVPAV